MSITKDKSGISYTIELKKICLGQKERLDYLQNNTLQRRESKERGPRWRFFLAPYEYEFVKRTTSEKRGFRKVQ